MNNDEKKFEQCVNSIRFDDEPSAAHRDKLEKQLLNAYDNLQETEGYVEPVAVYFRKLAFAASFLIVAGVLFWAIDAAFITQDQFADHPQKETIHEIIKEENVSGAEKKKLVAQIRDVWSLITHQDKEGLVSVLNTSDIAYTVRKWAANCLAKFGDKKTLAEIEAKIRDMHITDPQDPLNIAAEKIRRRLDLPQSEIASPNELPGMQSTDTSDCQPEME